MFDKILVANRGEIALRVIRACKEMGIGTVAVYSEADEMSLHVRLADEDVCIGPAPPDRSYNNIPAIISAAEVTGAQAIHPGYGFLAENARFAEIAEACELSFIGPTAAQIRLLGDKASAKRIMAEAGVPVVPGSEGVVESVAHAREVADQIGYPVVVKAVSGGGGRGIRYVDSSDQIARAFAVSSAEAEAVFGDGSLYLEKRVVNPRHVEVQILGDQRGGTIHLGERNCSIQRRSQKLLEEAPSPGISNEVRKAMGEAAVAGAKAVDYRNAGTIEFLLDSDGERFYFMEMNTRVQVEHPVTEMATGIDIVKEQISIAAEAPLSFGQEDVALTGHSIECRINAEDTKADFRPTPGTITYFHTPGGFGVRVDTHVYDNYQIPQYYDSMIAKLRTHGDCRDEAIARMERSLEEFYIDGVPTTIPFHQAVMAHPSFRAGDYDLTFVESKLGN